MGGDDNRAMTTLASTPAPQAPQQTAAGALRLTDWGVIRAQGEDAAKFLQGQLTQDVLGLRDGEARLAGYCSPKGRLLASFVVWRLAADDWILACSADLLAPTLKRLSMFVLRAKCRLSDASATGPLWGVLGEAAAPLLGPLAAEAPMQVRRDGERCAVRLPDVLGVPRWLVLSDQAPAMPAADPALWNWLEVCSGVVRIVAATVEAFVPQMVNLELVGGVSFKKGCYPGQEVVARSQYRGTLKRRGALLRVAAPAAAGEPLFHSDDPGQPAGQVALAAADPHEAGVHWVLAELKLAALGTGRLHLREPQGPVLTPSSLPYDVPALEEA